MTRWIGAALALLALAADQATKHWLLGSFDLESRQPVRLAPFLDLVLAHNRGISYSLFASDSEAGRLTLLGVTLLATAALAVWLWRTRRMAVASALGLVIGGALGNAYDRWARGAVVDFVWFHTPGLSWYIFNLADVAITAGVAILLADSFFGGERRPAGNRP